MSPKSIMIFLQLCLYHFISPQEIWALFGHYLGTKVSKTIVALSAIIYEKVSICKNFHSSRLFDSTNSHTIFYYTITQ